MKNISILFFFLLANIIASAHGSELPSEVNAICTKRYRFICITFLCNLKCEQEWDPTSTGKCTRFFVCECSKPCLK
ncbi:hypothetical protein HanXRQr2_Chr15g0687681 [Helianthus annuus]|uniref:Knottin, scorpion toxin-like protein n=1 Tax=Helianthus annuus TaxID=4232 RepID=A0A251S978_HELAN|nr:hypothetical protein HanXRQr2_Chr15g0687681 [Helianthus annuus]